MDRFEFMWRLKSLLSDIPAQEREEALQYYNDYFEDAGKENEAEVIASLGSPEKVAENIKRDVEQNNYFDGYEEPKVEKGNEIAKYSADRQEQEPEQTQSIPKKKRSGTMTALIVVLCICASPILLSLGCAAVGIFLGILGVVIAIALAGIAVVTTFGSSAFGLLLGGLLSVVVGIVLLPFHVITGMALMATGFLVGALGIVFLVATVAMGGWVIPKMFQGIGWLFRALFGRKKKNK